MLLALLKFLEALIFFVGEEVTGFAGDGGRGRTLEEDTRLGLVISSIMVNRLVGKRGGEELRIVAVSGMTESMLCWVQLFLVFGGGTTVAFFGVRSPLAVGFGDVSGLTKDLRGNVDNGAMVMYSSIFS